MKISQREARRLQKRVTELEDVIESQRRRWSESYVGGTQIATAKWDPLDSRPVAIRTARLLRHAVVASVDSDGLVQFIALPHPKVEP